MTNSQKPLMRALLTTAVSATLILTTGCDSAPTEPYPAAIEAVAEGDFQAARLLLQQELNANPANAEARLLAGKTHLSLENPEGAAEEFKKLIDHPEFGAEAKDLLAKAYVHSGNTKLAFQALEENGMNSGLAYAVSVVAHLTDGDADKAVNALDQGLASYPDSIDLKVLDAKRAFDRRDIPRARVVLAEVLTEQSNLVEARLLLGRLEMHQRKLGAAKEQFAAVINSNPWHLPAILSMAAIARDEDDEKAAAEWLAKAKEIAPGHPVGVYFAAQMAYEAGDVDTAHMLVQSLGTKEAEFPALRLLRGMISAQRGQTHTAVAELERFFRLGGENAAARVALAQQYAATNADQKAWDMLQPVLSSANASPRTLQFASSLAGKLGRPERASLASRAQRATGGDPYASDMVRAGAAIRAGKWAEADTIYGRVLSAGGASNPIVLNNAASVKLEVGDKAGAVALARKALALAPGDPMIMDTLGWSLTQAEPNNPEGRELIARAVELAPGNQQIVDHWTAVF